MKSNAITVSKIGNGFFKATLNLGGRVNRGIGRTRDEAIARAQGHTPKPTRITQPQPSDAMRNAWQRRGGR